MTHTSTYRMKGLATVAAFLAEMGPEIAERHPLASGVSPWWRSEPIWGFRPAL